MLYSQFQKVHVRRPTFIDWFLNPSLAFIRHNFSKREGVIIYKERGMCSNAYLYTVLFCLGEKHKTVCFFEDELESL